MAQYWEDWSGSTIGAAPTGWTERFQVTYGSSTVESHVDGPAGRRLRIDMGSARRFGLSMNAVDSDVDRATVKIRALMAAPGLTSALAISAGVFGRGAGSASSETAYVSAFFQSDASADTRRNVLQKYVSGTSTTVDQGDAPGFTVGDMYWIGLECSGTSIRYTLATAAAPSTLLHDKTVTDSSISAAGWVGLFAFNSVTSPYYFYAVGIGTDGDEAPISDPNSATHALAGSATVSVSATAGLTVVPGNEIKGVRVQLGDGTTPEASLTGLSVRWWDNATATGVPDYEADDETTDASGWLEVDLDAVTALGVDDYGYLLVLKNGATTAGDIVAGGRVQVVDIS